MLLMELKRSVHNKSLLFLIMVTVVAFTMGWALPAGLENLDKISYNYYCFSTYTVFTQFGFLLFSFVTAYDFNKVYRNKNTLFYKSFNISSLKFYYLKLGILFFEEILSIAICLFAVSLIFHSFNLYFKCLIIFSIVVFQYFMVVGLFSLLYSNMLVSLGLSITYWLLTVIMITFGDGWKALAVFDSSNDLYVYMEAFFLQKIKNIPSNFLVDILREFLILFLLSLAASYTIRKKWVKKGM